MFKSSLGPHPVLRGVHVALVLLVALPLVFLIVRATSVAPNTTIEFISSSATWYAIAKTIGLAVLVATVCATLATPLAWLTRCTDLPGRRWFRVLLVLPLAIPSYVSGFVVLLLFAPGGWFPVFDVYGWAATVLALGFTYPLCLLTVDASLARIDPKQWESARSLGCRPWFAFWRILFPQLRPAIAGGGLLVGLYSVGDFGAVSLLRFESLSYLVYLRFQSLVDRQEAVLLSLILILVAVVLVVVFAKIGGQTFSNLSKPKQDWPQSGLGKWRWPAFGFCTLVTVCGVFLPIGVVTAWLIRGLLHGQEISFPLIEATRSLLLGSLTAIVIVTIAFFPTLIQHFSPHPRRKWMTTLVHLGYALPGIVVALSLVSFAATWAHPLYQSIALLIAAYVIRFIPLTVHALDDTIAAQSKSPYWAARSLGCSQAGALLRIVVPNAKPAIIAGLLAVFISVVKELPATLILSPLDFPTLATQIWSLTEDAYFAAAAPPVLLLLGLAVIGLWLRPDIRLRSSQ